MWSRAKQRGAQGRRSAAQSLQLTGGQWSKAVPANSTVLPLHSCPLSLLSQAWPLNHFTIYETGGRAVLGGGREPQAGASHSPG